jgi:hypothetical protein
MNQSFEKSRNQKASFSRSPTGMQHPDERPIRPMNKESFVNLDLSMADPNNFRDSIGFEAESFAYLPDEGKNRRFQSVKKKQSRISTPKKKKITAKTKR